MTFSACPFSIFLKKKDANMFIQSFIPSSPVKAVSLFKYNADVTVNPCFSNKAAYSATDGKSQKSFDNLLTKPSSAIAFSNEVVILLYFFFHPFQKQTF